MDNNMIFYIMGGSAGLFVLIVLMYFILSKKMQKSDYQKKLDMWRSMIILNFESDPINCPICNNTMIYYNSIYT